MLKNDQNRVAKQHWPAEGQQNGYWGTWQLISYMLYDMNKWNWLQFCVKRQSRGMSRKYQDEEITTSVVFASLWFISWAFSFAVSPEFTRSAFVSSVDFKVKTSCSAVLPCHFKKKHFITYNGLCWRQENLFLSYSLSRDLHFSCSRLFVSPFLFPSLLAEHMLKLDVSFSDNGF